MGDMIQGDYHPSILTFIQVGQRIFFFKIDKQKHQAILQSYNLISGDYEEDLEKVENISDQLLTVAFFKNKNLNL